jgi:hypothetical protein
LIDTVNPIFQTVSLATVGGFLFESATDSMVATASGTQATAVQMVSEINRVGTVASIGDAVKLPLSVAGLTVSVVNHGANSMQVFGAGVDVIDDVATATGVAQMAGSVVLYVCATAGQWYTEGLGSGYAGQYPTVSYQNGLTANATQTQAGGLSAGSAITSCIARFTTVGTAGNAGTLPLAAPGMQIVVSNAGANSMGLFPNASDQINALGAGAVYTLAANKTASLTSAVGGFWHAVLSA